MRPCTWLLHALALLALCAPGRAGAATCDEPQFIAPAQEFGPAHVGSVAWNGSEFAALYIDATGLMFQRILADGTAAAPPVRIARDSWISWPKIVWNGTGYGIAWTKRYAETPPERRVNFARLGLLGEPLADPVIADVPWSDTIMDVTLAHGPPGYLVAYGDDFGGGACIRRIWLSEAGTILREDEAGCFLVSNPSAAWSSAGQTFVTVWTAEHWDWNGSDIASRNDTCEEPEILVPDTAYDAGVTDSPAGPAIAWFDVGGADDFYFSTLTPDGLALRSGPASLGLPSAPPRQVPKVLWAGDEFAVLWRSENVWLQRVSPAGQPVAEPAKAAYGTGNDVYHLDAAFACRGFLTATFRDVLTTQALACHTAVAPNCPDGVDAYGVTGSSAVVSWTPVVQDRTDIAYYPVLRDGVPIGRTAYPYFNDTALTPGVTYAYEIRTVNAAQLSSGPCPASTVSVTAGDALDLSVQRDDADVVLTWTGTSAPLYRVMRGESPRAMTELQRTADNQAIDAGAAAGAACYFYSVDPAD